MFQSLGHRVWHAYYCLPRDAKGAPPKQRKLEKPKNPNGPSNGALGKLMKGKLKDPGIRTLEIVAKVLECDLMWLQTGNGPAPTSADQIPRYPYHSAAIGPGLPKRTKASFERDTQKLKNGGLAGRVKSTSK